jgi:phage terminase large subunit-like protein
LENSSVLETLRSQPQFSEQLRALSDRELEALVYDWDTWARPNQIAPKWDWATWLILAGRGYGKTRVGAEMVRGWIKQGFNRVNLLAPTADDIRDVMVEGESGILAICPADERPVYRVSKRRLEWPNGAISLLFTAEEPNRLRGKQSSKLWCDEPAAWRYDVDAWDQAQFGLRIGSNPQTVATTTPRPTKLVRALVADSVGPDRTVAITRGTTYENRSNLAPGFYRKIIRSTKTPGSAGRSCSRRSSTTIPARSSISISSRPRGSVSCRRWCASWWRWIRRRRRTRTVTNGV